MTFDDWKVCAGLQRGRNGRRGGCPFSLLIANIEVQYRGTGTRRQSARARRTKGGVECKLTVEWAKEQFQRQNGRSYWFGLPLDMSKIFESFHPLSPSIDRIDNTLDHLPENCVITARFENMGFNRCNALQRKETIRAYLRYLNPRLLPTGA